MARALGWAVEARGVVLTYLLLARDFYVQHGTSCANNFGLFREIRITHLGVEAYV